MKIWFNNRQWLYMFMGRRLKFPSQQLTHSKYCIKLMKKTRKREPSSPTTCADHEEFTQKPYHSLLLRKAEALDILSGSKMPSTFRFRQRQSKRMEAFLQACMLDQKKGMRFLMLTGAPGAGKTLTANKILSKYNCRVISMNANIVKTLQDVQRAIGSQLLGKEGSSAQKTQNLINKLIDKKFNDVCVVFIQEVEVLFNKNPNYNSQDFLKLFKNKELRLVLVGISNTIDTLIKSAQKLSFRKQQVENIIFQPYGAKEIMQIMRDKLAQIEVTTGLKVTFQQKSLKYAANKLEVLKKGDFRVCLQFLKGVVQLTLEAETSSKMQFQINIQNVNQILGKMNIDRHSNIQNLPSPQQIMLVAIYSVFLKKDALCTTPAELKQQVKDRICKRMSVDLSELKMNDSLSELQQHSLVQMRQGKSRKKDDRKVMLKVGLDQIKYALNNNLSFKQFFPDS